MASANDVAAYIMDKLARPCSTMKLQKLLYYSQGWSLAWDGEPIFDDQIEAWANGPVVHSVFAKHRGLFRIEGKWPHGDADALSQDQRETVDAVIGFYGNLTGQELSDMTHGERPWVEARGDLPLGARSNEPLNMDTMQDYFGALSAAQ